jgi:hypothetical protein
MFALAVVVCCSLALGFFVMTYLDTGTGVP